MSKIPNWSRADEVYEGNPNIIGAWEHDRIAQRVFVEKRTSTRGVTFYTVQQQNYPNGFDGRGYIEEAQNPDSDTLEEAQDKARRILKNNPDGLTITKLTDIDVEDLPRKNNSEMVIEADIDEDADRKFVRKDTQELVEEGILKDVGINDAGVGVDKVEGTVAEGTSKKEAREVIRDMENVGYAEITEVNR